MNSISCRVLAALASWSNDDRDNLNLWPQGLATLVDPAIVHFSGVLHPSMFSVLNNSFQPWVSKPWGYSDAPGNPFTKHWWEVVEKTVWKGIQQDKTFKENLIVAKKSSCGRCLGGIWETSLSTVSTMILWWNDMTEFDTRIPVHSEKMPFELTVHIHLITSKQD